MKIVIPVKTNRENPPLAPLFGKAKWFAFVEDGKVSIVKNPVEGGHAVIEWFAQQKVDAIIFQEMGSTPYRLIKSYGDMILYHAGFERVLLDNVLQKFEKYQLPEMDDTTIAPIIAHHESSHSHGGGHHHGRG